jgi:hypothetical protein
MAVMKVPNAGNFFQRSSLRDYLNEIVISSSGLGADRGRGISTKAILRTVSLLRPYIFWILTA